MADEVTWENQEWLYSAKQILQWMATVPPEWPLMFLVRHSHRETLANHDEMASGGITELGKKMSIELGKRIPQKGRMHLFTSFVPRCFQTAEAIAEGFIQQGGEVIDIDPLPSLVSPQVIDETVWMNLHPDGRNITDFVNMWVDGGFRDRVESYDDYRKRLMGDTVLRLVSHEECEIHVHVTHDFTMMGAKRMFLERPLLPDDREPYLGGLGVTRSKTGLLLNIQGDVIPISIQ
ncbi:MAG: histidine phosphatase family protein [Candidatus Thorarchaeota archaeon]